jgi:hypothetical protein
MRGEAMVRTADHAPMMPTSDDRELDARGGARSGAHGDPAVVGRKRP